MTHYEAGPNPTARRRGLRWYLYRCFGAADELLYVGITYTLKVRFRWHRRFSEWHKLVVRTQIVEFADKDSAAIAELQVIMHELPIHNRKWLPITDGWRESTPEGHVSTRSD